MSRFKIMETPLKDLFVVERMMIEDERGYFSRLFCDEALCIAGWNWAIRQINHSFTRSAGMVRGMHYQMPPKLEAKLVSCLRGAVWDVAVDLRKGSSTFLQWHAEEISASNRRAMFIPPGFAHGFQAVCKESELIYCHSEAYDPTYECGLNPYDPMLKISWPLTTSGISTRDINHPMLDHHFEGVQV